MTTVVTQLIARGYRRTSRRHGMISRIDRPDWLEFLAKELRADIAQLKKAPAGQWEDHYRRCYSKDVITVPHTVALSVPGSSGDAAGYVKP